MSLQELWYNTAPMSQSLDTLAIHRSRRVMVAVKMMNATGRQRLRGVYRYLAEGHDWDLQLVRAETELTAPGIRQAERDGIQGFLVGYHPSPETLAALADAHVPVVSFMTNPIPKRNGLFRLPDEDNVHIGMLAAEHFRSLGRFRSFGFVPAQPLVANGLVATAAGIAATASVSTATGIATLSAATGITWLIILDKLASKRLGIYKLGLLDELTA